MSSRYGTAETRHAILEAARELAETIGPAMRIADVAQAAGVSRQALYLHFGDRKGLVLALLAHIQETYGVHSMVDRIEQAPSAAEGLYRLIEVLATLNGHVDKVGWLFDEAQHLDEAFGRDWRDRVRGTLEYIRATLEKMVGDRGLAEGWDVENAAEFVFAVTSLGTWRDLTRDLGWSEQQFVERAHGWASTILP